MSIVAIVLLAGFAAREDGSVSVDQLLEAAPEAERLVADASRWVDWLSGQLQAPSPPPAPDATVNIAAAAEALAALVVQREHRRGYEREDWPHWLDADGDCVDTRDEVLAAESVAPVRWSADGCDVVEGVWHDPYTGERYTDPRVLDIDHMVPLQEAHDSGGHAWGRDRRAAFANDLDDPRALVAVAREANRSKGAQGPEAWLPPNGGHRCRYVADWIAVKARWRLAMDESERVAVGNMLSGCRSSLVGS